MSEPLREELAPRVARMGKRSCQTGTFPIGVLDLLLLRPYVEGI